MMLAIRQALCWPALAKCEHLDVESAVTRHSFQCGCRRRDPFGYLPLELVVVGVHMVGGVDPAHELRGRDVPRPRQFWRRDTIGKHGARNALLNCNLLAGRESLRPTCASRPRRAGNDVGAVSQCHPLAGLKPFGRRPSKVRCNSIVGFMFGDPIGAERLVSAVLQFELASEGWDAGTGRGQQDRRDNSLHSDNPPFYATVESVARRACAVTRLLLCPVRGRR